jgi:hypothetical protein
VNPLDTGEEFSIGMMNPNPTSSKTKDGPKYRVSFEMAQEDWQCFMDANTNGMILEGTLRATEIPVMKIMELVEVVEKPTGGPLSKAAAMLCQDDLANKFGQVLGYEDFKAAIYARCGINSRSELDHNLVAAEAYAKLKSDFVRQML